VPSHGRKRFRAQLAALAGGVLALVALAAPSAIAAEQQSGAKACGVTVEVKDHAKYVVTGTSSMR